MPTLEAARQRKRGTASAVPASEVSRKNAGRRPGHVRRRRRSTLQVRTRANRIVDDMRHR